MTNILFSLRIKDNNQSNLLICLLILLLFGFIGRLENTNSWGCVIFAEPILDKFNIIFTLISTTILLSALKSKSKNIKIILLITELVFWTIKLLITKGGYAVGFGGIPNPNVLLYDFISILGRIYILFGLFNIDKFRFILAIVLSVITISIKSLFIPFPLLELY